MGKNSDVWKCMEIENAFENNKFTLRNLQPETLYELKMKSKNTNGSSNYTLLLFQRTRKSDLPEAIYRLREGDRIKYMKLMQSSEIQKRYFLRIMIVGKKSIGKTSLLRRLLKEHIKYVSSTDGVNIVLNRCKINIDNGKWTIESDKDTILQERTDEAISSDSMSLMFSTTTTSNIFSNMYAMCSLWDFSGQKELYAAHQAFLTSSAIYLVVADINDDCFSQDMGSSIVDCHHVGDNVDFWLDTIHCLRTVKNAENEKKKYTIDPFAFLVFTGTDKLKKDDLAKKKLKLEDQLKAVGMKSKYQHLQNTIYLSNTCDHEDEFEKLRLEISAAAREMKNWGAKLPIKWIMLEHFIEETKQIGKNFINLSDIMSMARHPDINLLDIEEMLLFLRFQHEVGNLIFFEDIHDLIIINPQWLADAFRCLVSDKYDLRLTPEMEFTQFLKNGKINDILIKELFRSKCRSQFLEQKDCLLKVMEKFDILVRIEDTRFYIIPSMMPDALGEKARRMICFESGEWYRTSWLCLKFTFLPPAFFNHIFVWLIKKYKPSQLGDTSESYELYHGTCIFDMDDQGCKKLIFTMSIDTIALRVVSKQNEFGVMCSILRQEILRKVSVLGKRYNLKICFELNFQCSTGHYYKNTMSYEYLKSVKEYTCKQHKEVHQSKHIYSIWMKNAPEFY